jgi:hypothetical protein
MRMDGCRSSCAGDARRGNQSLLLLVLMALSALTGCGGCNQTTAEKAAERKARDQKTIAEAKKRAEEEKKKEPFVVGRLTPLLSENLIETEEGLSLRLAKPGHWATTIQPMKANLDNFEGRITIAAVGPTGTPMAIPHTAYEMTSSRPAVLAKGRTKRVENELLIPSNAERLNVSSELTNSAGSLADNPTTEPWTLMPSHQYFLMVLAREPSRYAFLKVTDSVKAPYEDLNGTEIPHYRVVLADGAKPLPLPPNVLTWTSVAYVVWDEVNLDRLDPAQQEALVDWIHWGGRLIINGPDSLDGLRASFLKDYLPADVGERITFDQAALADFSNGWSRRTAGKPLKPISVTKPWSGVGLKPRDGAKALPHADKLFYERSVGAGSIVVSAVQLAERDLVNWPGFDGFLNGALLRRPPREFQVERDGAWVGLQMLWAGAHERVRDAYYTTPLRWFARDAATTANARDAVVPIDASSPYSGWQGGAPIPETSLVVDRAGGLGEWNEFGPVSDAGRDALVEAAGVRVPAASFVVICLAVYLVVLVPLNWMVFYALGRVEWAWISAPLIALAGTMAVVRQAQLDIGFVRSQTEIALMELQGDLPRGHLTRYTAIYSSLSDTYDLEFENSSAVASPFPRDNTWTPAIGDTLSTVAFEKYDQPRLRGVEVSSATTQMIHSEQMLPLDGPIRLRTDGSNPPLVHIENKSGFNLTDVAIVFRKGSDAVDPLISERGDGLLKSPDEIQRQGWNNLKGYWLGDLKNGTAAPLPPLRTIAVAKGELPFATERAKSNELARGERLNVDPLLRMAFWFPQLDDPIHGRRDEYRLVGRIDEVLPGSVVSPEASQTTGSTVVLAHLKLGEAPFPAVDKNSPLDVQPAGRKNAYEEEELEVAEPTEGN